MKKTIFAIAFAVGMPLMFAAQTPAPVNPPASGTQAKTSTPAVKSHKKHAVKKAAPKKSTGVAASTTGK